LEPDRIGKRHIFLEAPGDRPPVAVGDDDLDIALVLALLRWIGLDQRTRPG